MEGARSMDRNRKRLGALAALGIGTCMVCTADAQETTPPPPVITLQAPSAQVGGQSQYSAAWASTQAPRAGGPTVYPSTQAGTVRSGRLGGAAVGQLRNPFEWEGSVERRGLFEWFAGPRPSAQFAPQVGLETQPGAVAPGAGLAPPGGAAAPGMAAATPETGALPGASTSALPSPAEGAEAFASAMGAAGPGFGGGAGAAASSFPMIGDRGPLFLRQNLRFPPVPTPLPPGFPRPGNNPSALIGRSVAAIVPSVRGFKIADNQFPRPVDRVWVSFNYFNDVNAGLNDELGAPIKNMQVYNEVFGLEKTFLDRQASVGFRIPLNTLTVRSSFPGLSGTHTSTGNFSSYFKYAFYADERGNLLSAGLDMTYPTGPTSFAGYPSLIGINAFELQPFLGYIFMYDRAFVQGFTSIAVPMDRNLATMWYGDVMLGYFLFRSQNPSALLTAIVPAFETHLNIPLNWAGFQPRYIGSTPDVVDLTFGLNVGIANRAILSTAYVCSVTGPAPFNGEYALMLNIPFGGRPGRNIPITPPLIGR